MFHALLPVRAGHSHGRATLFALALAAGLAAPLVPAVFSSTSAHRPGATAAGSAYAAAPDSTSAAVPPTEDGGNPPPGTTGGLPVHLPFLGASRGGAPAPAPRPGSGLTVPSVGLQVSVIDYADCTGGTDMTRSSAVHFMCTPGAVTTFVGHNPGVFTPLLRTHAGDRVYYRHDGVEQAWILGAARRVTPQQASEYSQDGSYAHAVFATCAEPDSSAYWIFLADPVGGTTVAAAPAPAPQAGSSSAGSSHPAPAPSPSPSPTNQGPLPTVKLPPPPPPPH